MAGLPPLHPGERSALDPFASSGSSFVTTSGGITSFR